MVRRVKKYWTVEVLWLFGAHHWQRIPNRTISDGWFEFDTKTKAKGALEAERKFSASRDSCHKSKHKFRIKEHTEAHETKILKEKNKK